jgi:hypothetical protein
MSGDDLSVQLFIEATAIAVLALAVSQAGWKHLWFVRALFGVAIIVTGAIFRAEGESESAKCDSIYG